MYIILPNLDPTASYHLSRLDGRWAAWETQLEGRDPLRVRQLGPRMALGTVVHLTPALPTVPGETATITVVSDAG